MYRSKGPIPKHNDWYWLKYLPKGSIARTSEKEGKKPDGREVARAIDCHTKAADRTSSFPTTPNRNPNPTRNEATDAKSDDATAEILPILVPGSAWERDTGQGLCLP